MDTHGEIELIESADCYQWFCWLEQIANWVDGAIANGKQHDHLSCLSKRHYVTKIDWKWNEMLESVAFTQKKNPQRRKVPHIQQSTFTENCLPNSKIHLITLCHSNSIVLKTVSE